MAKTSTEKRLREGPLRALFCIVMRDHELKPASHMNNKKSPFWRIEGIGLDDFENSFCGRHWR